MQKLHASERQLVSSFGDPPSPMQRLHASERELVSLFSAHSFCSHTKAGTAGRLFVCVSASSEPREFWSVFSDAVVAMGHRCLTFDSYGRGATPMPADGYVTRDAEAELIEKLLDDLVGGEPCILVAHSSGGLGAAHFADLHPERVSALVLLAAMGAPMPRPLSSVMCVFGLCMVVPFIGKCFARSLHGAYCSGHRKTARERGDPQDGERMISYFRIQAARPEYDRTQRQIISDGWAAPETFARVGKHNRPVLIAHADDDAMLPSQMSERLASYFANSHVTTIKAGLGGHHFVRNRELLRPGGKLNEALDALLGKLDLADIASRKS